MVKEVYDYPERVIRGKYHIISHRQDGYTLSWWNGSTRPTLIFGEEGVRLEYHEPDKWDRWDRNISWKLVTKSFLYADPAFPENLEKYL